LDETPEDDDDEDFYEDPPIEDGVRPVRRRKRKKAKVTKYRDPNYREQAMATAYGGVATKIPVNLNRSIASARSKNHNIKVRSGHMSQIASSVVGFAKEDLGRSTIQHEDSDTISARGRKTTNEIPLRLYD
jgi:hypothetical protein